MDVKRGDVVTVVLPGDYGKPRPALVVQADLFNATHSSVTLLPLTSTVVDAPLFRMTIDPNRDNGLTRVSQIMVDKIITVPRDKVGASIGRLEDDAMLRVGRALAVWLGIA
jgi:mRNA interferase MazF